MTQEAGLGGSENHVTSIGVQEQFLIATGFSLCLFQENAAIVLGLTGRYH